MPKAAPKAAPKAETMGDDYTAPVVQKQAQTGYTAPAVQQQAQTDILKSTLCSKFARYLHNGTVVFENDIEGGAAAGAIYSSSCHAGYASSVD